MPDLIIPNPYNLHQSLPYTPELFQDIPVYKIYTNAMWRRILEVVLPQFDYNEVQASKFLGINRNTLRKYRQLFNVKPVNLPLSDPERIIYDFISYKEAKEKLSK